MTIHISRLWLLPDCVLVLMLALIATPASFAQITATGDYSPTYDGSDPWNMGASSAIGITGVGTVEVMNGSQISSSFSTLIGDQAGSNGTITISGAGSLWTSVGGPIVGVNGTGTMTVESGAQVDAQGTSVGFFAGSSGVLNIGGGDGRTVTYSHTSPMIVGRGGTGELNITSGAVVSGRSGIIGSDTGSNGEVTVSGAGSKWELTFNGVKFGIGANGTGRLVVEDGGTVEKLSSGATSIGALSNGSGEALVSGTGSLLTTDDLDVGDQSNGDLEISDGGRVQANFVVVGVNSQTQGTINVTGTSSALVTNQIRIGEIGSGEVSLLQGGDLIVKDQVDVDSTSSLFIHGGDLEFTDSDAELNSIGELEFTGGTIKNAHSIDPNVPFVQDGGALEPGNPIGVTRIFADYVFNSGFLCIDIDSETEFDVVVGMNDVDLGGTLEVSLAKEFNLQPNMDFQILTTALTRSGTFDGLGQGGLVLTDNGFNLRIDYLGGNGNDIVLTTGMVTGTIAADGRKLLDGVEIGGSLADTTSSDNVLYQLDPPVTSNPTKQIVELILLSESPTLTPNSFLFALESAMSGGPEGDVIQCIELWNETDQKWEVVDARPASNTDVTVDVVATGDLSRFVHPLTSEIIAKVRWVSPEFSGASFNWSVNIDQAVWFID